MIEKIVKSSILVCALAFSVVALAEPWTFVPGEDIPLDASYVTTSNCNIENGVQIGSTKSNTTMTISLNNSAAGDYVLYMKGGANGLTATYTVTVSNESGYNESMTVAQANTGNWTPVQVAALLLKNLPSGEFTLSFRIVSTTGSYAGNYGYFNIKSLASGALAVPTDDDVNLKGGFMTYSNCRTSDSGEIGWVVNDSSFAFLLYCAERGKYAFSYMSGAKSDYGQSTLTWKKKDTIGGRETDVATQEIGGEGYVFNSSAVLKNNHTHDIGILDAGLHILTGYTTKDSGYVGNFGNFAFTMTPLYTVTVPEVANATVSVTTNDVVMGTSAGVYEVEGGTRVVVTYTADDPEFALSPTGSFIFDSIDANEVITAPSVIVPPASVTVPTVEHATVSVTADGVPVTGVNGVYEVEKGQTVVVTYTPDEGYGLTGQTTWTIENVSGSNVINVSDAPVAAVALAISSETGDAPISADARAAYASRTGCSVDGDNGTIHSTKNGHTFSFVFYSPKKARYGFSFQSGQKEDWGAATLNWTLGSASVGATEIGGEGYTYNGSAILTVSHTIDLGILEQGIYTLTCTFSKSDGNYCGNYGNFAFTRKDGVAYKVSATVNWTGARLVNAETLEDSDYGLEILEGGKLVVDLSSGLPGCDGTRSCDGTIVLPAVKLYDGATIEDCVSVIMPAGYDSCYFTMFDGFGVIGAEVADAAYAASIGVVKGTVDQLVAVAAEMATVDESVVVTLDKAASSVALRPGVSLALASGVAAPETVTVNIGGTDATGYYTAESLAPVNGVITPVLESAVVTPSIANTSDTAITSEGVSLGVSNVKAGLYYGLQNSGDPATGFKDDKGSFVQAVSAGESLKLDSSYDLSEETVQFFKIKVSDINPNK